jgi:glycosyltransferase involved in cell wall biosynthesis
MANPGRCIFYRTLPMVDEPMVGSDVRPAKLLQAFRRLGFEVDLVAGHARDRKPAAYEVRRKILSGRRFDFLYAEPPTTPIPLNEPHHVPTHPLLDYSFLTFCHSRGIPIVLFYCDVQWRLRGYASRAGWWKYMASLPFFHLDLTVYRRVVDALLVPDLGMLEQIGAWASTRPHWASIPGFDPEEVVPERAPTPLDAPLRLFYVGGLTPPVYDLTPLLEGSRRALQQGLAHSLTICCREAEWARRRAAYGPLLGSHVEVVHNRNRQELLGLYSRHDIAVMPYGTPNSDWAMPVKFPEAIGTGLPVLSGAGTAVAKMVAQQDIGWSVGGSVDGLSERLRMIDRAEIERVRANVDLVRPSYTWDSRAREIAEIARSLPHGAARPSEPDSLPGA